MTEANDTLGAGSYPEPTEYKEKIITGKIVVTFDLDATVPSNWNSEDIKDNIKEDLGDYVDLNDFKEIDINIDLKEEE